MAAHYLRTERPGHTLQPTALVHEAWLRLSAQGQEVCRNREQFMALAASFMRRILVDHARAHATAKRNLPANGTDDPESAGFSKLDEILTVDEAVTELATLDPPLGRIVELRYFAGLTVDETAGVLGISPRTVKREWALAAKWLRDRLSPEGCS